MKLRFEVAEIATTGNGAYVTFRNPHVEQEPFSPWLGGEKKIGTSNFRLGPLTKEAAALFELDAEIGVEITILRPVVA